MTERQSNAIRTALNAMREDSANVTTVRTHMRKAGFSVYEINSALAEIAARAGSAS